MTEEESAERAFKNDFGTALQKMRDEHRAAASAAIPALARLVEVMHGRSGQPYKLRSILYSLWNGKPTSMVEITGFDWAIRKDLCAVFLAFGYEDESVAFFYNAVQDAIKAGGQWEWFLEEQNVQAD